MSKIKLDLLTDEAILDYTTSSTSSGPDHVITDRRDIPLNRSTDVRPYSGSVYDAEIFGSPFYDRCICGKIRQISHEPCPFCGCRVYGKEEGLRQFARIELGFYYLNDLRFEIFLDLFYKIFADTDIKLNIWGDLKRNGWSGRGSKKFGIKIFDTCQFDYSPTEKRLTITEFITDESKCSYEGLLKIIEEHFPGYTNEYKRLINRYYLVLPSIMRPYSLTKRRGKKIMVIPPLTLWYEMVVALCCPDCIESNPQNYAEIMKRFKLPGERVRYTALLRQFLNIGKKMATTLLNTSKKSEARGIYAVRVPNSARCPIVPSTEMTVDEIGIPYHLAYEMCREGFIKHLMETKNFTLSEAKKLTKHEWDNPETKKLFKEYAEDQIILVNRQPTLHEFSIFALKLRLVEQDAVAYPIELCGPLNADFDGDTVSFMLVPEEAKEETYLKMSPRYNKLYKKNLKNIFEFNHETLNGLACATEWKPEKPEDLENPVHYYTDYVDLLKDVEIEHKIDYCTPIVFTGKVGSVKYQNKITTYGRLRLSKIIDADIEEIKVGGEKVLPNKYKRINAGAAAKLMSYLYSFDDWPEKANEIQKFVLKVVTKTGVVTFDYKTLYVDTDTETYKDIRKIADSKDLTDQQKLIALTDRYAKYEKEIESKFSDDLKQELDRANRVKISSIVAMNTPQMIISGVDEVPIITKGNLLAGYDEDEYITHAVENRSLQILKNSGVKLNKIAY